MVGELTPTGIKIRNSNSHPGAEAKAGFRDFPFSQEKNETAQICNKEQKEDTHLQLVKNFPVTIVVTSINRRVTGEPPVLSPVSTLPLFHRPSPCLICSLFSPVVRLFKLHCASWKRNVSYGQCYYYYLSPRGELNLLM